MDMYYKSLPEKIKPENYNFDNPKAIDINFLLKSIKNLLMGKEIKVPIYDFKTHKRKGYKKLNQNPGILILEGIFLLYFKELRKLMDFTIFLEAEMEEIIKRRIKRDLKRRGSSEEFVRTQLKKFVLKGNEKYVLKYKKFADLIIPSRLKIKEKIKIIIENLKFDKI